ncbi:hypothetical protein [Salinicoccus albus]|uniref:hypothetical protein n=1 Tax=Salinicoccus albus TaxID=418756 RepID=UPI000380F0F6|nr:hypothetical protein [Salinicoccus albus]
MNPLVYIVGVFLRPVQTIKDENAVPLTGSLMMPIILMMVLSLYTTGVSEIIIRYIVPEQVSFSASVFVIGLSFFIWILLFFAAGFYSLYLPVKILNGYPPSHRKAMHDHGVINIWCLSILLVICVSVLGFAVILPTTIANLIILGGVILIVLDMAAYFVLSCMTFFRYSKAPGYKRYKTLAPAVSAIAFFLVGILFLNPVVFPGLYALLFG